MGKRIAKVLDIDGSFRENPDFPIAIVREYEDNGSKPVKGELVINQIVDPVFNSAVVRNLYGRIMTLLEATTDAQKVKSVKDVFSKEITSWEQDIHIAAKEISVGGNSSMNIYTRGQ